MSTATASSDQIYQIKVALKGIRPLIWRRILMSADATCLELAVAIMKAMGWKGYHLYHFEVTKDLYVMKSEDNEGSFVDAMEMRTTKVSELFKLRQSVPFAYDMGDGWMHSVKLEKTLPRAETCDYPVCTGGKRACPPEDCGGTSGYQELLETLKNPNHSEFAEMKEWLERCGYGEYDADKFVIPEDISI